jgi:hypothetical protein
MFDDVLIWLGPLIAVTIITGGVILVILVLISWMDTSILERAITMILNFVDSLRGLGSGLV